MGLGDWSVESLPAYQSRTPEEIDWLWSATLPENKDTNPVCISTILCASEFIQGSSNPALHSKIWLTHHQCHAVLQAVWDSVIGFFEDAIVASCSRPGKLVITPVSCDSSQSLLNYVRVTIFINYYIVQLLERIFQLTPIFDLFFDWLVVFFSCFAFRMTFYLFAEGTSEATKTQWKGACICHACHY